MQFRSESTYLFIFRLENFEKRKIGVDAVSVEMMRKLTDWEKKLLETQELMEVRGKVRKHLGSQLCTSPATKYQDVFLQTCYFGHVLELEPAEF